MSHHVADMASITVDAIAADGDYVVVQMPVPWTVPGKNEPIEIRISEWYTFRDGKVAEIRPYFYDTAAAAGLGR